MVIGFCFFLLERIWELKKRVEKMEDILKLMNDDLNMVNKTMTNQKQVIKG
jgi:hypothetical protein